MASMLRGAAAAMKKSVFGPSAAASSRNSGARQTNRGKMASNPVQSDEETLQKSRSVSPASYRSSRASSAEAEGSDREGSRDDDTVSSGQGSSEEEEMIGGSGLQEESDSASDEGNVQEQGEDTRGNGPGESDNDLGSPDAWWKGVQEDSGSEGDELDRGGVASGTEEEEGGEQSRMSKAEQQKARRAAAKAANDDWEPTKKDDLDPKGPRPLKALQMIKKQKKSKALIRKGDEFRCMDEFKLRLAESLEEESKRCIAYDKNSKGKACVNKAHEYSARCPFPGCKFQVSASFQCSLKGGVGGVKVLQYLSHSCSDVVKPGDRTPSCAYTPSQLAHVVADDLHENPRIHNKSLRFKLGKYTKNDITDATLRAIKEKALAAKYGMKDQAIQYLPVLKTEMKRRKHGFEYFTEKLEQAKQNYLRRLKNRYDNEKDKAKKNKTLNDFPPWNEEEAIDTTNKAFEKYKPVDGKDPIFFTGAFMAPRGSLYAHGQKRLKHVWMGDAAHMHLKSCESTMFCYNALDANRHAIPMVIGVCTGGEDVRSWNQCHVAAATFYPELQEGRKNHHTFITDGQKGLWSSLAAQLPLVHHASCSFHIHQNLIKRFKTTRNSSGDTATSAFTKMVKSRTFVELAAAKKKCDPKVLEYITNGGKTPEASLFPCLAPNGNGNYGESSESSAESINNQYDEARSLHPYGALICALNIYRARYDVIRTAAHKLQTGKNPPMRLGNTKGKEQVDKAQQHRVIVSGRDKNRAQVESLKGDGSSYTTNLATKTCSCGYADKPCSHLIAHAWEVYGSRCDLNFIFDDRDTNDGWKNQYPQFIDHVVPAKEEVFNEVGRVRHPFLPPLLPVKQGGLGRPRKRRYCATKSKKSSGAKRKAGAKPDAGNGGRPNKRAKK